MNPFVRDNLKQALSGKNILLGISGSIAAFKTCDIVRYLRECEANVRVVLTDSAQKFVTPLTLETLSEQPVLSSIFEDAHGTHHIDAARWADVALIAPATANIIAKMAQGLADDLLSTELLAFTGPVLVAPAMNPAMYAHPAVQANVRTLLSRDVRLLGPAHGETACGEEGPGRMLEPEQVVEGLARSFDAPQNSKRVLITLGPTQSKLDPVRFISNRSSGLMGAALCWSALRQGYQVTAICGPTDAPLPSDIDVVRVTTAAEMAEATQRLWPSHDIFIGAAAVLDWDVKDPKTQKIKKASGLPHVEFATNADILANVSRAKRGGQFVLGFAAETENVVEHAREKLEAKKCDAVFANDVAATDQGFESQMNAGWWITSSDAIEIGLAPKPNVATAIWQQIQDAIAKRHSKQEGKSVAFH